VTVSFFRRNPEITAIRPRIMRMTKLRADSLATRKQNQPPIAARPSARPPGRGRPDRQASARHDMEARGGRDLDAISKTTSEPIFLNSQIPYRKRLEFANREPWRPRTNPIRRGSSSKADDVPRPARDLAAFDDE